MADQHTIDQMLRKRGGDEQLRKLSLIIKEFRSSLSYRARTATLGGVKDGDADLSVDRALERIVNALTPIVREEAGQAEVERFLKDFENLRSQVGELEAQVEAEGAR